LLQGCDFNQTLNPGLGLFYNRVFRADAVYPHGKRGWRAERAMVARRHRRTLKRRSNCSDLNLRGRRPVRADRRLCTDEKHIRAQSAILDRIPTLSLSLFITVYSVRMVSIRTEYTVGARSAQWSILNNHNAMLPLLPAKPVNCAAKAALFD